MRKAAFRRAALEDGVIDILCGLCLLGWGLLMEAGQGALGGVLFSFSGCCNPWPLSPWSWAISQRSLFGLWEMGSGRCALGSPLWALGSTLWALGSEL